MDPASWRMSNFVPFPGMPNEWLQNMPDHWLEVNVEAPISAWLG
jgi:hypothetical protein